MKNTTFLSVTLCAAAIALVPLPAAAQAPDWQWSAYAGNTREDIVRGIAVDPSGNVYAVGSVQSGSLTMGSVVLDNPSSPKFKLFVAKYDKGGRLVWAKTAAGEHDSTARSIDVDAAGNSYVGGYFTGRMEIGPTTLVSDDRVFRRAFIAKYDTNGDVQWAQSSTGAGGSRSYSTLADARGNMYVAGTFSDDLTIGTTTLRSSGGVDLFLMKLNGSGKVLWATTAGGSAEDTAYTVSSDASGHLYLAGYFFSPEAAFGATKLVNADSTGKTADLFVAKYTSDGKVQWARRAGGPDNDYPTAGATDRFGNTFTTGFYKSATLTFDTTTLENAGGPFDGFIAKYDTNGTLQWARNLGSTGDDRGVAMATDSAGNCVLGGIFQSSSIRADGVTFENRGTLNDFYLVMYDKAGRVVWGKSNGGTADDIVLAVALDRQGNIYVGGGFKSVDMTLGTSTYKSLGSYDVYVGKLGPGTTKPSSAPRARSGSRH